MGALALLAALLLGNSTDESLTMLALMITLDEARSPIVICWIVGSPEMRVNGELIPDKLGLGKE